MAFRENLLQQRPFPRMPELQNFFASFALLFARALP